MRSRICIKGQAYSQGTGTPTKAENGKTALLVHIIIKLRMSYTYFEDFFRHVSEGKFIKRKYIRIFTCDEISKRDIMYNLRQMNKGLIKLFSYSDFDIVMTKESSDQKKMDEVIEFLSKN